jgi:RNA polymerase sigma-70 factor (ECF subfamily)
VTETHDTTRRAEEAAWVAQTLAGDPRGYEALMQRYHGPLRRLLQGMLHNAEDTDDLLQETFVRAFRFLHRYDPARPFGPWLMRIGANLARNQLRRRTLRAEVPLEAAAGDSDEPFEGGWLADYGTVAEVERGQLIERVRRAMASLPEELRAVLEMRVMAEMSYKEIAEALGIPIGTVMSRLNRARGQVQAALADLARPARASSGSSRGRAAGEATPEVS